MVPTFHVLLTDGLWRVLLEDYWKTTAEKLDRYIFSKTQAIRQDGVHHHTDLSMQNELWIGYISSPYAILLSD